MKFPTGFAIILLGTVSIAAAEPSRNETAGRVSYTNKKDPAKHVAPHPYALHGPRS